MADQDLYSLLQNVDPETLQAMIQAGLAQDQMGLQGQRVKYGEQLAGTQQPEGRQVGNTYVAASPLEHLAAAVRNMQGQRMMNQGMQAQQGALQGQGAGRIAYLKLLAGRGQPPPQDIGASPQMVQGDLPQE
jgi:hypothetical protein